MGTRSRAENAEGCFASARPCAGLQTLDDAVLNPDPVTDPQ